jgi:bifunctional DNA-binding transcriptional regulator/antitoxin component of YhaV-PrlF toxin-antitoxin module
METHASATGGDAPTRDAMLANSDTAMQYCDMTTTTVPVSKRGALTLPPELRRKLGLDRLSSPLVIIEEREGGLFLQPAAAVPIRDIPKETIARWIARDEAEMARFVSAGKRKRK